MAKRVIELTEPIRDHRGLIRKIELREPKFSDLIDFGLPTTRVSVAGGGGFVQETSSVIGQWAERLANIDPNFLGSLCLRDSLAVRSAIINFFIEAAMPVPTAGETTSSPSDEPSFSKESGTPGPSRI